MQAGRLRATCFGVATGLACCLPIHVPAQVPTTPTSLTFTGFGARLLAAAAARPRAADSNTVVSPVSAGLALSLASLGAGGGTATALASMLGSSGLSRAEVEKRGASLIAASTGRHDVRLEIANALWTDNSVSLTSTFASSARTLRARVGSIDLHSPHALTTINTWADSATHGRIKRLLTQPLADTTLLFIGNAVYFKGKWLTPFDTSRTRPRPSSLASGRTIQVPSMERTGTLRYARDSGYQMVRIPYTGDHVAMYVILPDTGKVRILERRFAERGWPASLSAPASREVHLVLPRLHVEQETDLLPIIAQLGAGVALDCKRADFRGVAIDRAGHPPRQLCIGTAIQKVYLDVDEEGTEAAAITGIGMVTTTAARLPVDFVVDRPFFILLRDESTGADLFVGSIRHP